MADELTRLQELLQQQQGATKRAASFADSLRDRRAQAEQVIQQGTPRFTSNVTQTGLPTNPIENLDLFNTFARAARGIVTPQTEAEKQYQDAISNESDLLTKIAGLTKTGTAATVDELLKLRKSAEDANKDTSIIDKELEARGFPTKNQNATKDIATQINDLKGADRTGARAVKDILDVVDRAQKKFAEFQPGAFGAVRGEGTGPLSVASMLAGKASGNVTKTEQLDKELREILRTVRKESTGVAFSPQEVTDLLKEIPSTMQQEANVADSLSRLKQRMVQKLANYGIDATSTISQSAPMSVMNKGQVNADPLGLGL